MGRCESRPVSVKGEIMTKMWKNADGTYEDSDGIIYTPNGKETSHTEGMSVRYATFYDGHFKETGNKLPFEFYMLTGEQFMRAKSRVIA